MIASDLKIGSVAESNSNSENVEVPKSSIPASESTSWTVAVGVAVIALGTAIAFSLLKKR
jgi:hypothetical protein